MTAHQIYGNYDHINDLAGKCRTTLQLSASAVRHKIDGEFVRADVKQKDNLRRRFVRRNYSFNSCNSWKFNIHEDMCAARVIPQAAGVYVLEIVFR